MGLAELDSRDHNDCRFTQIARCVLAPTYLPEHRPSLLSYLPVSWLVES